MQEYLNQGIKGVINQFPAVENILNDYNIGCAPCSIGSCLLKDIIDIHNLSPGDEEILMGRIAGVIYPGQEVEIPMTERKAVAGARQKGYSPPMKKLVDEHVLIKRLVALIPGIIDNLDVESAAGRGVISDSVDFIRSYADKYHHAKEEDILLKYADENMDIIKTIYQDHENGRGHVRAILKGLADRDAPAVGEHLKAYQELLTEHIKKEDEILYPWMDRKLSITRIGELFSEFNRKDEEFGDTPVKYEALISRLEPEYKLKEEVK